METTEKLSPVYQRVADAMLEKIKSSNELPWKKPWTSKHAHNPFTGTTYSGVNFFILNMVHGGGMYATFKQITQDGGTVKKGSHGIPILYAAKFHEMGHSTGHAKRLGRQLASWVHPFGSPEYSREELVAEFTSAYLCAVTGITNNQDQSVAYCQSWIKALTKDPGALIYGSREAAKASDLILGANNG